MFGMKTARRGVLALGLSASLGAAFALSGPAPANAQEAKSDYQPTVGQRGKDVVWVPTNNELVNRMLEAAKVTKDDRFAYDSYRRFISMYGRIVLGIDGARALDRNQLLASVLAELNVTLLEFERTGFDAFRSDWQRRHVHQDCPVKLTLSGGASVSGLARGVREDGALLLETAQGIKPFHSGDVSVRAAERLP